MGRASVGWVGIGIEHTLVCNPPRQPTQQLGTQQDSPAGATTLTYEISAARFKCGLRTRAPKGEMTRHYDDEVGGGAAEEREDAHPPERGEGSGLQFYPVARYVEVRHESGVQTAEHKQLAPVSSRHVYQGSWREVGTGIGDHGGRWALGHWGSASKPRA